MDFEKPSRARVGMSNFYFDVSAEAIKHCKGFVFELEQGIALEDVLSCDEVPAALVAATVEVCELARRVECSDLHEQVRDRDDAEVDRDRDLVQLVRRQRYQGRVDVPEVVHDQRVLARRDIPEEEQSGLVRAGAELQAGHLDDGVWERSVRLRVKHTSQNVGTLGRFLCESDGRSEEGDADCRCRAPARGVNPAVGRVEQEGVPPIKGATDDTGFRRSGSPFPIA